MSFSEPAYALPIILDGTETLAIAFSAGASTGYTATLTAGTYYNHRIVDADSLTKMIDDVLDAAESTAGNTATWVESEPSTGLSFRMQLDRTGDTGDVVSSMTISDDALRQAMGFSELVVNNLTELSNSADDTTLEGSYQRGYLWVPRTILGRDERIPLSEVAGKITAVGRAVVDGYGQYERIRHVIEFVPGPLVYTDKAADSDFQGVQVTGLALGDDTAPLDQFWRLAREGSNGAPPVIKYIKDTTATSVSEDIVIADVAWLTDMETVAEEMSPAPLLYRVRIEAMESVGTSFTSTGPTIGNALPADPTQYDTYALLPTTGTEGDWSEVTTTGAAGAYRWMESLGGVVVKAQLPSDLYRRALNGTGFLQNGGGDDHSWLSANGGGPNTAAALPAVGWVDASSGSGTITDVGGDTQLDAPSSGGLADMNFATNWPDGQILVIAQFDVPTGASTFSATIDMAESNVIRRLSWAHAAVKNDVSFTGAPVGGPVAITNFGIVFGVMQQGAAAAEDTDLAFLWDSNAGWVKAEGVQQNSATGIAFGTPDAARFFSQFSVSASRLLLRRWQVIDLGQ